LIAATVLISIVKQRALKATNSKKPITATIPLTINEQHMFFRLAEAFPDEIILAQVAFSALLNCKNVGTRNRFDRKRADFVICTKAFSVIAVVELDDSSHRGREKRDAERDKLLTNAGYKVLRYRQVPDTAPLQADVAAIRS